MQCISLNYPRKYWKQFLLENKYEVSLETVDKLLWGAFSDYKSIGMLATQYTKYPIPKEQYTPTGTLFINEGISLFISMENKNCLQLVITTLNDACCEYNKIFGHDTQVKSYTYIKETFFFSNFSIHN